MPKGFLLVVLLFLVVGEGKPGNGDALLHEFNSMVSFPFAALVLLELQLLDILLAEKFLLVFEVIDIFSNSSSTLQHLQTINLY
jgi:hypothetical protein